MAYYAPFYQPAYYNPAPARQEAQYNQQFQQPIVQPSQQIPPAQQGGNGLIWVQGEAGAKSYLVAPGNTVMLMDSEGERFFLKSADASGMPLPLRTFEYKEVGEASCKPQNPSVSGFEKLDDRFVTRDEFERWKATIGSGCKCKEHAKNKLMEDSEDAEPAV